MNSKEVKLVLDQLDLKPKKHLGQNFIIDNNLLNKIISLSEIQKDDVILEIGPGLGALTKELVEKARKVYAVEIDPALSKYISRKFKEYDNIEVINEDILGIDLPKHSKVVSNIPHSITGPIFEKLFFKQNPSQGILTIEKSIANRIFLLDNYKNFSRISIGVNSFMKPVLKLAVSRNCFYPTPKIDLSLIKIIPREEINKFFLEEKSITFFLKFIASIMPYKNKNIANALNLGLKTNGKQTYTKESISQILKENNIEDKKLFSLQIEGLIELARLFFSLNKN
jgi:16S rRNA (adenine1518-N6/adenine1519-N6)-dimethyltransferase